MLNINSKRFSYLARNTWPNIDMKPIVKGQGIYFWDVDQKVYMDFSSQTLNLLLGQCHPEIVKSIKEQAETLTYATSRFSSISYLKAAEKLVNLAPNGFTKANIKMCDGSDANETAIKTAKKYTGKTGIISFNKGHTGQTTQTIQLRGYARNPQIFLGNTEDVVFVDYPEFNEPEDYKYVIADIKSKVLQHGNIAAILLDPIMVNAGVLVGEDTYNFLHCIQDICKENNMLFILDENQSFGWIQGLFATNFYNLSPDIITLGKGLSAGHPLAGVLIKEKYDGVLDYNDADFTHGGHALTCAAAFACLNVLEKIDFELQSKEQLMRDLLLELKQTTQINFKYRGVGLIHGISIEVGTQELNNQIASEIYNRSLEEGLFTRLFANKIILKPPVIVTQEQIKKAFNILQSSFRKVETLCV